MRRGEDLLQGQSQEKEQEDQQEPKQEQSEAEESSSVTHKLSSVELKASARALINKVKAEAADLVGASRSKEQANKVSSIRNISYYLL